MKSETTATTIKDFNINNNSLASSTVTEDIEFEIDESHSLHQEMATTSAGNVQQPGPPPRVSFRDLCSLFCCPPLPSSIVAKLAFMPPDPSYRILTSDAGQ